MKLSKIGWTDFSGGDLNFVTGCTPVSEGCQHCYARAIYERFGRDHSVVQAHGNKLDRLCRTTFPEWSPKRGEPHRPMAFAVDTGDLFHESIPDHFILEALRRMAACDDVIWQILTKRAARMRRLLGSPRDIARPLCLERWPNIWLGVTAENQARADERIPLLLDTPAAVRFVSVEPMLGFVELNDYTRPHHEWDECEASECGGCASDDDTPCAEWAEYMSEPRIDWVICGAESGPHRRHFDMAWAEYLRGECEQNGVPFFGKQDSAQRPGVPLVFEDGLEHKEWPGEPV